MLKVTQLFIDELDKRGYAYRPVEQLKDGREIVRLGFKLENAKMTLLVVFDPEGKSVAIRCFDFIQIKENQFPQALMCCNTLNVEKRWVKFCIDDDMDIIVEDDAVIDEVTAGEEVLELVMRMAAIIDDAYPVINKAIWA